MLFGFDYHSSPQLIWQSNYFLSPGSYGLISFHLLSFYFLFSFFQFVHFCHFFFYFDWGGLWFSWKKFVERASPKVLTTFCWRLRCDTRTNSKFIPLLFFGEVLHSVRDRKTSCDEGALPWWMFALVMLPFAVFIWEMEKSCAEMLAVGHHRSTSWLQGVHELKAVVHSGSVVQMQRRANLLTAAFWSVNLPFVCASILLHI